MSETCLDTTADPFVLDIQIVTDVDSRHAEAACATDDGCESTCASACSSE